jgi:hypothetical protein
MSIIADLVQNSIKKITENGYILRKTLVQTFRNSLTTSHLSQDISLKDAVKSFENKLTFEISKLQNIGSCRHDSGNILIGIMYYDRSKLCDQVATDLYELLYKSEEPHKPLESDF